MKHMLAWDNIAIVTARSNRSNFMDHFFCSKYVTEVKTGESTIGSCIFPLYVKNEETLFYKHNSKNKIENLLSEFRTWIDKHYGHHYSPEEILGYIYGVLHSSTYRTKYVQFLKMDFPRIPFVKSRKIFEKMSKLGWELVQTHLMKEVPNLKLGSYIGQGSNKVEKVSYHETAQKLSINSEQYFEKVSKEVWGFHIGGYQVLAKYLKSRKDRELSLDEIQNLENVVNILAFTITQMKKIDEVYHLIEDEDGQ